MNLRSVYLDPVTYLPTPAYRKELLNLARQIMRGVDHLEIRDRLMRWEEDALTGIIRVTRRQKDARHYIQLLHAVWGPTIPFAHKDGTIDLANSTLVLTIQELRCKRYKERVQSPSPSQSAHALA